MISSKELSVVVQGPIHPGLTADVLASVREHLPESEIILSTWIGQCATGLKPDQIVLNEDPGEIPGRLRNINRQIVSTRSGLERASRKYAMKLRSDACIDNSSSLCRLNEIHSQSNNLTPKVFKKPIMICRQFTRDPSLCPLFFHPSDIFMFGCLEDLRQFWFVSLVNIQTTYEATDHRPWFIFKYVHLYPEQYIWRSCLAKAGFSLVAPERTIYLLPSIAVFSEKSLLANFSLAQAEEIGIRLPERLAVGPQDGWFGLSSCYEPTRWEKLTRLYAKHQHQRLRGLTICGLQIINRIRLRRSSA